MILYLIKSTLLLGVLLALYKLLLENEKMHRFNRLYLIMALVLGFTAPLISIEITSNTHIAGLEMETLNKVVNEPTQRVSETIQKAITTSTPIQPSAVKSMEETSSSRSFPIRPVLWGVYGVVLGLLLIRFIVGLIQIRINIKNSELDQFSQATLVLMDTPITPQSFLHYIFLNKQEYQSGKVGSEILEHEYTHVRQLHSVDVMFIELLKLLFWFNPLLYLYKHAIQLNHEFLADEYVVNNVSSIQDYQKKLIEVCETKGSILPVTSMFASTNSKKRFYMLAKSITVLNSRLKKLFTACILLGFTSLTTLGSNTQTPEKISEPNTEETNIISEDQDSTTEILFNSPVDEKCPIATKFDRRTHPLLQTTREHTGVDYKVPIGTPVYASAEGTFTFLGRKGNLGNVVILDHGNGFASMYAHLAEYDPKLELGSKVSRGEQIALSGNTGLSEGPHLHFSIEKDSVFVDPEIFLSKKEDNR